ncbi:MAG TPA: AAA family ATPase, partial [Gaiellaceae bacterium]|nr:AAA family ATPase [Gaiellaceae bacterium]
MIGRSEEVEFCRTPFARREGNGIVVTGAAGVGKTRLAAEVVRAAEDAGYAAVRVTATEAGRAIPLGPFAHLLPADADSAATLLQLLRLARAAIAVREDRRPVALLVDDAHLLDPASAMLVQQLVAEHEATVVATVRTGEPVPDAVVALWKDHGCEYIELQPLSTEETGLLVESVVGGEVDGETKHRLWNASRGLPLIVRELVLDGLERSFLTARAGLWRWRGPLQGGGRLMELIGARIGHLDDQERVLMELVALGEPLGWSLLETSDANAADDLIRRGLLAAERDGRRLELRLAHPLFGESVRASMPATRGATLQRRLADALEATGLRRSGDLLRHAVWRVESGGTAASELLLEAATVAFSRVDPVLSERLARAATEVGGGFSAELAVARALSLQERFAEADAILVPLTAEARTDEERASVAIEQGRTLLMGLGRSAEAEAVLVSAKRAISDKALKRELELERCFALGAGGRWAEAASASSALFDGADDDHALRLHAGAVAAPALVQVGRVEDALAVVARCEPFAEEDLGHTRLRHPTPFLHTNYLQARTLALLYAGRLAEADGAAREAYELVVGGRATDATAVMAIGSGLVALAQGDIERSSRWFREAAALLSEADPSALACMAQALGQAGDAAGAKSA